MTSSAQVYPRPTSIIAALFPEYRQRACRYAYWMLGNDCDAEEVVQEAFVRLTQRERKGDLLECESRFAGLLFTTVRNLSIDLLRKRGRRRQVPLSSVNEPTTSDIDQSRVDQLQQTINRLIEELPDNHAEALKLKTSGDLTYEQIAEVLDCTKAQVRTWIFRARQQLAKKLAEQGWLDPYE